MIACACGMSEWLVECECVCKRMDERMVSGWNECEHGACATQVKKNEMFSVARKHIIYTTIGVCE